MVDEPAALSVAINVDDSVSCNGGNDGSLTASASGGTANYTFLWNTGGTSATNSGLTAGLYTVTVTDANGCTVSDTMNVYEPSVLVASATLNNNVSCNGGNDGSATASAAGGTAGYTFAWSMGGSSSVATGLTAGCYTVTATDANGCTNSEVICITEPTVLVATASIDSNTLCSSTSTGVASVVASGGALSYTYSWSSGSTSDTANSLSSGWHYVTVTDTNNCTAIDSVEIDVQDTIAPTALTQNATVYLDSIGNVSIDSSTIDSGSFDNCAIDSMYVTPSDFDCSDVGNNTVTLYVIDVNGNIDSATSTVHVVDTTAPFVGGIDTTLYLSNAGTVSLSATQVDSASYDACGLDSLWLSQEVFSCNDLGDNLVSFYAVDVNGNLDTTQVTISVIDTWNIVSINIDSNLLCFGAVNGQLTATASGMTGSYSYAWSNGGSTSTISGLVENTYIVTATSAFGCEVIDSVTLTEPDSLYGAMSISNISCNGANDGSAIITANGGSPGYSYLWNTGAVVDSIGGLAGGTYSVTISDTNGCAVTMDTVITEPTALVVNISFNDTSLCAGDSSGIAIANASGGTTPYSYSWTGYAATNDSLINILAGTYTTVITDANGCVATDTQTITEDTLPNVTLTLPIDSVCQFTVVQLSGQTPIGGAFSGQGVVLDSLITDSLSNWNSVTYTFTDSNGCAGIALDSVYITPLPQVSFSLNPIELCGGSEILLDFASPTGGVYSGDPMMIDTANGKLIALDSNYTTTGWYTYMNECDIDSGEFTMISHKTPEVDLGGDQALCNSNTLDLDAGDHDSYLWNDASTNQILTVNDGETPLNEDVYVWVQVSDTFGCTGSDTILVEVEVQTTFYLGDNITACLKDPVTLTVDNVYDNFNWSTGDSTLSILAHDGSVIIPGQYPFWVTGTNDNGACSYSDTIMLTLVDCDTSFVGIEEAVSYSFEIFPNPTREVLNVNGSIGVDFNRIMMISMRGEIAKVFDASTWNVTGADGVRLDVSDLADGVYMLRIEHAKGINTARVIVGK